MRRKYIYADTKREVTERLTRMANQKLDHTLKAVDRLTVGEYLDQWLLTSAKPNLSPTTYHRAESSIRLHIKPYIGSERLQRLTPLHIQFLLTQWDEKDEGPGTRMKGWEVVRRALNVAVRLKLIQSNPCDCVDAPTVTFREIQPTTNSRPSSSCRRARERGIMP